MGWERRGRGYSYVQTLRRGGRFEHVYVGRGPLAELAAQADALLRAERKAAAEARRAERARWGAALAPLAELGRLADLLSRAALQAAGYHQHDRGQWRMRRGPKHEGPGRADRAGGRPAVGRPRRTGRPG